MASRMVEVRLKPLGKAKGGADEELAAATAWAKEHSGALLARASGMRGGTGRTCRC